MFLTGFCVKSSQNSLFHSLLTGKSAIWALLDEFCRNFSFFSPVSALQNLFFSQFLGKTTSKMQKSLRLFLCIEAKCVKIEEILTKKSKNLKILRKFWPKNLKNFKFCVKFVKNRQFLAKKLNFRQKTPFFPKKTWTKHEILYNWLFLKQVSRFFAKSTKKSDFGAKKRHFSSFFAIFRQKSPKILKKSRKLNLNAFLLIFWSKKFKCLI